MEFFRMRPKDGCYIYVIGKGEDTSLVMKCMTPHGDTWQTIYIESKYLDKFATEINFAIDKTRARMKEKEEEEE